MTELTWHLDQATASLDRWYKSAEEFIDLAKHFRRYWDFKSEKGCKQQALKCKTLGLVFHDRYKLVLEK